MRQLSEATMKHWREVRKACLENAQELLNSARTLKGKNTTHIRYHLAVLAMEEVGKVGLLSVEFSRQMLDENDFEPNLALDNHVKKLFWAIFTPFIEQTRLTKEEFESYRGLAKDIHGRRLESLYTNPQIPLLPKDRVVEEEADNLIRFAESRLNLERGYDISDIPDEPRLDDFNWFYSASNDQEKRRHIFSTTSLDKLADLGNVHEWIKWLREEFTKSEEESREILRREMAKGVVGGVEGDEPKWKVKFRVYSASHSIRRKGLNKWNGIAGSFMKLDNPNKQRKNEIICELTLGKRVPVRALWDTALGITRSFVAALNIGSMGLFWWHVDKDITRFYEKILDIENDAEPRVSISPQLSVDWGHQALTEDDAIETHRVFGFLLKPNRFSEQKRHALEIYLTGLVLTSKIDIHLRLEASAFEYFFKALKTLFAASGDWDGHTDLKLAVETQLNQILPTITELSDYLELGMRLERRDSLFKPITLTEVVGMKFYCDSYFILLARREIARHRAHA